MGVKPQIEQGAAHRAGLISTNSIRGGANRKVLERVKDSGDIFMAWNDEPWVLDGAAVRVSIVGFDDGSQTTKTLDGEAVANITPALTSTVDLSVAKRLKENANQSFEGVAPKGKFDLEIALAEQWIKSPNPNAVSNGDVLKTYFNAKNLVQGSEHRYIVDFTGLSVEEAERYVLPFEHVKTRVKPARDEVKMKSRRENWWLFGSPALSMREQLSKLERFIVTPNVSKHHIFAWLPASAIPSNLLIVFTKDDDYTFGVLHSKLHEVWSLAQGTWLGKGNDPRYTPTTCFETFPFPHPTDAQRAEIEKWANYLHTVRSQLLEGDDKLTMTKLYNALTELRDTRNSAHPAYALLIAHDKLDAAVAAAYGWEWPLSDEEILERLLELNLERTALERKETAAD